MGQIAPNGTYHYVGLSVKDRLLADTKYANQWVFVRMTDFEDGNEISTETDEGHTGVATLDMGSYRTEATSSPSWTDKLRYGEGLEEIMYLLFGTYTSEGHSDGDGGTITGVYDYSYSYPPSTSEELPLATIINGFGKSDPNCDARVWNNAMLNEFTMNFSNENAPTMDMTFVSDYNNFNLLSPSRDYLPTTNFVKVDHVNIYMGAVGDNATTMRTKTVNCFTESSFTINNNAETQACVEDTFGKNSKFMGTRETTGSITMPWTDATKLLEPEYEGASTTSHIVSTDITHKQIWYEMVGTKIGSTNIPYSTLVRFPEVEVTSVTSPKSGSDAKDLTLEYKVLENPQTSFAYVDIVSDLSALRIDDTGVELSALYCS